MLTLSLIFLIGVPFVFADSLTDMLGGAGRGILSVGSLSWMGVSNAAAVVSLTRILIWVLTFTVLFALIMAFGQRERGGALGFLNRNQALIVAAVIATITAIFLPPEVLLATGTGWATIVALILVGGPVVGIGWLLWQIPGRDAEGNPREETRATVALKIIICLILFWILSAMKVHVAALAPGF